jgi:AcrR family transcriptional regulator
MGDRTFVGERASDKRTAILEATLDLISERGFHNTPMSLIAKASGASTGIIYHYFASKEELIQELYTKIKTDASRAMLAGYSEDTSFRERFLVIWFNVLRYALYHPKETAFWHRSRFSIWTNATDAGGATIGVPSTRSIRRNSEGGLTTRGRMIG